MAANSNRLTSTTAGAQTRSFTHDAAGNMLTDSRTGTAGLTFQWDQDGRLTRSYKTATPVDSTYFVYDARHRLASRRVTGTVAPTNVYTLFIHDLNDRIIAETNNPGATQREYIWADDIPIAVVANVATSPALHFVHTDHLMRPARMTNASGVLSWDVVYRPFGEVNNISEISAKQDLRFPGHDFWLTRGAGAALWVPAAERARL